MSICRHGTTELYIKMATRLQKRLAEEIIKDASSKIPRQKKDLLVSAGYDVVTAEASPGRTIDQVGVREALTELGFSEDGAKKVVAEILYSSKAKDHDRLDAADKVFKAHGTYAPEKHMNLNVEVEANQDVKDLTEKLNALYGGTG